MGGDDTGNHPMKKYYLSFVTEWDEENDRSVGRLVLTRPIMTRDMLDTGDLGYVSGDTLEELDYKYSPYDAENSKVHQKLC